MIRFLDFRQRRAHKWHMLILFGAMACSGTLGAAERNCAHSGLDRQDENKLKLEMKSVLPYGVSIDAKLSVCRNSHSASAYLQTEKKLNDEGVEEWWTLNCDRDLRAWSCEAPERKREKTVAVSLGGAERELSIEFGSKILASTVQYLATRALEILDGNADTPTECHNLGSSEPEDATRWKAIQNRYRLRPADTHLSVMVSKENYGIVVALPQTIGMEFRFDGGAANIDRPAFICWNEYVEVN